MNETLTKGMSCEMKLDNWYCMIRKSSVTEAWDSMKHILCYVFLESMP